MSSHWWASLGNFPFTDIFPLEISILVHPNKFQWFQKVTSKKRKRVLCSFSYLPFHFKFSSSLFPFLLFFPLPSLFPSFPLLPKFLQTFQGWVTRPPLVTPLCPSAVMFCNEKVAEILRCVLQSETDYEPLILGLILDCCWPILSRQNIIVAG